jgi:outer membrane receptor protein involved in Fe transport
LLLTYSGSHWGGTLGGSFIGRRPDSDFLFCNLLGCNVPPQNHTAGYARVDLGGWRQLNHYVTAYADLDNALNRHYEEVSGFPAPRINFRAGLRFRVGGE